MTEPCETIQAFAKAMAKFAPKKVILSLDTWRCPHCGHFVATNPPMVKANFCSYCGLGLEWPALTNFEKVTESIDALIEFKSAPIVHFCIDGQAVPCNLEADACKKQLQNWLESEVDHE